VTRFLSRPIQLFPAIFAKQDSDASATKTIETALPGVYSLSRCFVRTIESALLTSQQLHKKHNTTHVDLGYS
jgi:hypothetical protein